MDHAGDGISLRAVQAYHVSRLFSVAAIPAVARPMLAVVAVQGLCLWPVDGLNRNVATVVGVEVLSGAVVAAA